MMAQRKSELEVIGEELAIEIGVDAKALGPELFGSLPDTQKMTRPTFILESRKRWLDPVFRQAMRVQQGDKAFVELYKEMVRR